MFIQRILTGYIVQLLQRQDGATHTQGSPGRSAGCLLPGVLTVLTVVMGCGEESEAERKALGASSHTTVLDGGLPSTTDDAATARPHQDASTGRPAQQDAAASDAAALADSGTSQNPNPPSSPAECNKGDYGSATVQIKTAADAEAVRGYTRFAWLTITADDLVDLKDLSCLTSIGGDLEVFDAQKLRSLDGLEQLASLFMVHVSKAPALEDVHALRSIRDVEWVDIEGAKVSACDLRSLRQDLLANGVAESALGALETRGAACP